MSNYLNEYLRINNEYLELKDMLQNYIFLPYISNVLKKLFINLNNQDFNRLLYYGGFLIYRFNELFVNDFDQFKFNNDQDIKSIILLLLPYINDEGNNAYSYIHDLNEIILSKELLNSDFKLERSKIVKSKFKYSTFGIGLFDNENKIKLIDGNNKLIYKIIHHNFISLNETLSMTNGKLYINWINIVPLTIENYKNSQIYNNTDSILKNIDDVEEIDEIENIYSDYKGLYIGDFYNIYRNIFYQNIKKIKWLIFITDKQYYIQYLNDIFNFDNFFKYNSYDDLEKSDQLDFSLKLKNIKNMNIWKDIIIFFANNYTYAKIITIPNIFKMNLEKDALNEDFNKFIRDKFNSITDDQINDFLLNIDPVHIWDYIKECLIIFQSTIYSSYLIENNKITNFFEFNFGEDGIINLKNIYNIAKSLSHYYFYNTVNKITDWIQLPIKYSSLSYINKILFWNKFLSNNNRLKDVNLINENYTWVSFKKISSDETNENQKKRIENIMNAFNKIKYDLCWEYLVRNGLLSEFKINSSNKLLKNVREYNNAYYFLTNDKYKNLIIKTKDKNISFIDNLENNKWYTFYSMNWINQINFFKHYLNHRVLYITGATGQGKSTQIPKLFMYALKMIDYRNDGKVVCTQPRISPTTENALRISYELGLPIEEYNNTFKENIKSNKYYVQYLHSNDKHTINKTTHVSLKLTTDGTLINEMINNPILKEEYKQKIKNKNEYETFYYSKNKYDILIVDEAHEHNPNMDLILTLARQACYINNSLKLVIMSATIDDDEPIFRRYFHIINDNLVYPLKSLINKTDDDDKLELSHDSIFLDRRMHISPVGVTTQYNITEIYEENKTVEDIIKIILASSSTGDILIFENGTNEIYKRIKSLNTITPSNVVILPFIATINEKYKNIIQNIDEKIYCIRNSKNKIPDEWQEDYIDSKDVPFGTYTRAIIIATNVAEASLTLRSLKYVIDNGYSKVNIYSDFYDQEKLIVEMIAESNRKQRKGRVGRVSSGTAYYLYKKGSREDVKQNYKINQIDFGESLLKLLKNDQLTENIYENENEQHIDLIKEQNINLTNDILEDITNNNNYNESIIIKNYDPNFIKGINSKGELEFIFVKNITNPSIALINNNIIKTKFYRKKIYDIIKNQFYISDYSNYSKYWNTDYYSNINPRLFYNFYRVDSGYEISILLDRLGLFYIIHPFENKIKRNILGNIIEYYDLNKWSTNDNGGELPMTIYVNLICNLNNKYFLVNIKGDSFNFLKITNLNIDSLYKTELIRYIDKLRQVISLDELDTKDLIILLTSQAYDSFNEVLEILTLIKTIKSSMKDLIINKSIYDKQDIEIEYLYTLIQSFKKSFSDLDIFKFTDLNSIKNMYESNINIIINEFLIDRKNEPILNKYTPTRWNNLNYLYLNGSIKKYGFLYLINDVLKKKYNIDKIKSNISRWCDFNNINSEIFIKFINNFINVKIELLTIDKNIDYKTTEISPLELMKLESYNFKKSLSWSNKLEHIIKPFLHGYPYQISFKLHITDNFFYSPQLQDIKIGSSFKQNKYTLLFYYNLDPENKMLITNKIDIEWLFNILPTYYKPSFFKNNILSIEESKIKINTCYGNLFSEFCYNLKNKWSLNSIPYIGSNNMEILALFFKNYKKFTITSE